MSIFQHWLNQRDALHASLTDQMSPAETVYQVRHALLQAEQNALSGMDDEVLRQQAGVLMGCIKGGLGLLEAHSAGKTWIAQKAQPAKTYGDQLPRIALALLAASAILCGLRDEWIALALSVAGIALSITAWLNMRKGAGTIPQDEVRVSVGVDTDRMIAVLDAQLRAADRYLEDFAYLNDQARGESDHADPAVLSRCVELMEALYDVCGEERAPVEEAARQLLHRLGLDTVDYTEETSRLFNALPSKSVTRTLSPAIVSIKDQKLLRRGTAAVRIDAA